jgi:hypothetical protein
MEEKCVEIFCGCKILFYIDSKIFTMMKLKSMLSSPLFIQLSAQLNFSERILRFTSKFTLKLLPHVSV